MKKIIIAIVVIVVLLAGGFFFMNMQSEKSLNAFANSIQQDPNYQKGMITMSEISAHNTSSDCWTVINGDVLDISKFIGLHPGGKVIIQACGKDATEMFNNVPEHAKPLVTMLAKKLAIGKLQN